MTSVTRNGEPNSASMAESVETAQTGVWKSDFGREYTERNTFEVDALDTLYRKNYGLTRKQINETFLRGVPRDASFLEVGCNTGNQLLLLQRMGYFNLSGIELQPYALEIAKSRAHDISWMQGSVHALPYGDRSFDMVFTSGVLIHIAPEDLPRAMDEIYRVAKTYIWGFEYYAPETTAVKYRGNDGLLWKMDYARRYLERFKDLRLIHEQRIPYIENPNVDTAFLLTKTF
jgi:pseudaminic acid biosynthesis-associated methylase